MQFIEINKFINQHITKRPISLFKNDIDNNRAELSNRIKGKSVLVIGGAGTIGSSFIKALLPFKPGKLMVVDYNENGLTELTRDLRSAYNEHMPKTYITYPFDFGGAIFEKLFTTQHFDIVACFAAHKHVRSEKDHLAIEAMVRNNVFNTKKILDLALENKPEHFFSVSTDKAANPVNVMGASKSLMEYVLMAYSRELKISTARFANVAFSNGSLLFGFIERMMKKQPLSAPNDIKRYFVSPIESGELCLLACILGNSGEIFFPNLHADQMMKFSTIAEAFLQEMNLKPDYCSTEEEARTKSKNWDASNPNYPVYFFKTDTSGEKPFEEFFSATDNVNQEKFEALGVISNETTESRTTVEEIMKDFEKMFEQPDASKAKIVELIGQYLKDFSHIETGKSLDEKL